MTIMDTWLRRWVSRNAPQSPTSGSNNKGYISIPKDSAKGITSESDESDGKIEDDTKMKNPCSDCEYKDDEYCRCLERYKYDHQKEQLFEPLKELINLRRKFYKISRNIGARNCSIFLVGKQTVKRVSKFMKHGRNIIIRNQ